MRLLIFAPMPSEIRPVVKILGLRRTGEQGRLPVYGGRSGDTEIVLTGTGIGPALATEAAERMLGGETAYDRVAVCGIAGGLESASRVGDLVVPAEVYDGATGERFRATPVGDVVPAGVIRMSDGDDYEFDDNTCASLVAEGVTALDMETAAVARACEKRDIPWIAFRVISDMAGDKSLPPEVLGLVDDLGRPKAWASIRYLVTHPRQVPFMLKVGRDSASAATKAAKATASGLGLVRASV